METTMVTMQDSEVKNSTGGSSVLEDQVLQTLQANQILDNQIEENSNTGEVGETPAEGKQDLSDQDAVPERVDQKNESTKE